MSADVAFMDAQARRVDAEIAEANARLLLRLKEQFGCHEFGSICGFFRVSAEWRCPCCFRSKAEVARVDKNGRLLCAVVDHHDHFGDHAHTELRKAGVAQSKIGARVGSFCRFQEALICQDCNVAEPKAKQIVNAPKYFSFAPHEIAAFIGVAPNAPHAVEEAASQEVYAAVEPIVRFLERRLWATMAAP